MRSSEHGLRLADVHDWACADASLRAACCAPGLLDDEVELALLQPVLLLDLLAFHLELILEEQKIAHQKSTPQKALRMLVACSHELSVSRSNEF